MNKLLLLFLFFLHFTSLAQDNNSVYQKIEDLISEEADIFKNIDTKFISNTLIGHRIVQENDKGDIADDVYFVNDKYYLTIDHSGKKTLGTYIFKVVKNIPLIVLLDRYGADSDNYKGLIFKQNNQKFNVNWNDDINHTYKAFKQDKTDEKIVIDGQIIKELNFYNPDISFDIVNAKIGINLNGKKIIDNVCDSLKIDGTIATVFNSGKNSIYNLNGKLLEDNLKASYPYSTIYHQVIDSENNMFFIDTLGHKSSKPVKYRSRWGNDSDPNSTVTYYSYKNRILKNRHQSYSLNRYKEATNLDEYSSLNYMLFLLQEDSKSFDEDKKRVTTDALEEIVRKKHVEELFFLKKIFKEKEYVQEISYYLLSDCTNDIITLPKRLKKVRFINNSTSKISAEDYWYYIGFYKPLEPSYIIAKKANKFGVWDLKEEKTIIPFDYNTIEPKKGTYLLLEKNNLVTYYPNIGLIPKYKYLSDYKEYFARFEYPDGKKGWVNRKGIEYYD